MSPARPPVLSPATAKDYAAVAEHVATDEPESFAEWLEEHDRACARAFAELVDAEIMADAPTDFDADRVGYRGRGWE